MLILTIDKSNIDKSNINRSNVFIIAEEGNLYFVELAAQLEKELGKPVLAINALTFWHALRSNGIPDRIEGFGSLLAEHLAIPE